MTAINFGKNKGMMLLKRYDILLADPPWEYKTWSQKGLQRSAENHYPTMTLEQICALPIPDIAAKDSVLFLWTTFPNLQNAFRVIDAWQFSYKCCAFVWVKKNRVANSWFWGMGHWTRSNAEVCLLATKGAPKRVSRRVHQIIDTPIEAHSKKPGVTRARIVELIGDLPRIELFARDYAAGWDVWGNEVNSDITFPQTENKEVRYAEHPTGA